jgi:hypothetical protein
MIKRNRRETARFSDIVRAVDKFDKDNRRFNLRKEDRGKLVRYYQGGWYIGHLIKISKTTGTVQPISAYKGVKKHQISLPLSHIELIEERKNCQEVEQ